VLGLAGCSGDGGQGSDSPGESPTAGSTPTTDGTDPTTTGTSTTTAPTTPEPTTTTPTRTPPDTPVSPPDDATVLFGDGVEGLSEWVASGGGDPPWTVAEDGSYVEIVPGSDWIETADPIGDCHLHLEFQPPAPVDGEEVGGNSGVFMMKRYEFQVLNNRAVDGTSSGMAGAYFAQAPPLVDSSRPSDRWQAYDIIWRGPNFEDGQLVDPARATVFFNGVVTSAHLNCVGVTSGTNPSPYAPHPEEVPLQLQDHDQVARFRNIWYRSLPAERDTTTYTPTYDSDHQQEAYDPNDGDAENVDPGPTMADPPSDATVLLAGGDLSGWTGPDGGSPGWTEADGYVSAEPGAGNITSEAAFGDCQLHAEFRIPEGGTGRSGVMIANRYEFAINGDEDADPEHRTGAYPEQAAPLQDAAGAAGEWQTVDVVWEGPRFGPEGTVLGRYARATVLVNGVVVQNRLYPNGPNADGSVSVYRFHETDQPLGLRGTDDPVHFRNVWYRPLD
jgi:hypothetical protein